MVIDGNILFTGSDDHTIRLWELTHFFETIKLEGHTAPIQDILFFTNGLLVSCGNDNKVIAWTYKNKEKKFEFDRKEDLRCIDYVETTKTLLIGTGNNSIVTHDITEWLDYEEQYYRKLVDEDGNIVVDMDMDYGMERSYGDESSERKWDPLDGQDID